jgi:hypothetical protein
MAYKTGTRQGPGREGHDFESCRSVANADRGFCRWGEHSGPQALKRSFSLAAFGTTISRALPDWSRG